MPPSDHERLTEAEPYMALVNCPECERQISDQAPSCPQCGVPRRNKDASVKAAKPVKSGNSLTTKILAVVIIVMAFGVWWAILRSRLSNQAAPPSAGLAAALRQPVTMVDEKMQLREGEFKTYAFSLRSDARI